jgi:hypothetical protein
MFKRRSSRVSFDETGFSLWDGRTHQVVVRWADVRRVTAWKKDLVTTDLVCLTFALVAGQEYTVHEEMDGFDAFAAGMEGALPGVHTGWRSRVVPPAFAPNPYVLFDRERDPGIR